MAKDDLILHKEFGVNPTIPVCEFCGKDKNEVVLLGNAYGGEAPSRMIVDHEPCEECQKRFDNGWKFFIGDCGHNGFVKETAIEEIFNEEAVETLKDEKVKVFRMEKCFQCLGLTQKE